MGCRRIPTPRRSQCMRRPVTDRDGQQAYTRALHCQDSTTMAASYDAVRYGAFARLLHWATAILVLVAFIYGPGGSEQRVYATAKDFDRQLHETLGIIVLALTLIRLAWRAV